MIRHIRPALVAGFALPMLLASEARAASGADQVVRIDVPGQRIAVAPTVEAAAYGLGAQATVIPVSAFRPGSDTYAFADFFGDTVTPTVDGNQRWFAPLDLPSGAVITQVDFLVTDGDGASDITAYFEGACFPASGPGPHGSGYFWSATSTGISGDGVISLTGSPITNVGRGLCAVGGSDVYDAYYYKFLAVFLETTSHSFSGAVVQWHRSVSAAPLTATFADVPTDHPLFQFVEALVASGVTAGCGSGNYCPNGPLTRGQMAVFLAKALGLHWPQ